LKGAFSFQMPAYQATQQLHAYQQPPPPLPQPITQPPGTPQTAQRSAAMPPPSPKDIESELLRHHMQVLSSYVDRCGHYLKLSHCGGYSSESFAALFAVLLLRGSDC
jgi:hypothetical protein